MVAKRRTFIEQEPGSSEMDPNHCVDNSGLEISLFLVVIFYSTLFT